MIVFIREKYLINIQNLRATIKEKEEIVMRGTVIKATGNPKPHDFQIKDQDGEIYFAHLGDLQKNEDKLYDRTQITEFSSQDYQTELKMFHFHPIQL